MLAACTVYGINTMSPFLSGLQMTDKIFADGKHEYTKNFKNRIIS